MAKQTKCEVIKLQLTGVQDLMPQREPIKSPEFFSINGSTAKARRTQQTFQPEIV